MQQHPLHVSKGEAQHERGEASSSAVMRLADFHDKLFNVAIKVREKFRAGLAALSFREELDLVGFQIAGSHRASGGQAQH
jgi:hypothetical protein